MTAVLYLWVRVWQTAPPGYRRTGVVSRSVHTGQVRSELYEKDEEVPG